MRKKIVILIILGGLFLYFLFGFFSKWMKTEVVVFFTNQINNKKNAVLKEVAEKQLEDAKGSYGIFIKNLKDGQSFTLNEDTSFESGSLYKLWVLLTAFSQIEKGQLKEDEVLSDSIPSLNSKFNISSESAELNEGGITLKVSDAMEQMITISHNYAALLLSDRVKVSNVSKFLKDYGFNNSSVGVPPKTTAFDTALFFEKLYKGELANEENTKKILEMLKRQQLNGGLPKYLPKGVQIGHKTGEIGWFKHDAGIVFKESGDYIIAILSESESPLGAQERIAKISKAVYDYFE